MHLWSRQLNHQPSTPHLPLCHNQAHGHFSKSLVRLTWHRKWKAVRNPKKVFWISSSNQTSANWGGMVVERLLNETLMSYISLIFLSNFGKNHRLYITSSQAPPCYRCKMHPPFTQPGMTFLVLGPKANIGCVGVVYLGGGADRGGWKIGFLMVALSFGNAFTPEI